MKSRSDTILYCFEIIHLLIFVIVQGVVLWWMGKWMPSKLRELIMFKSVTPALNLLFRVAQHLGGGVRKCVM